jgi:hypothetical protein
MPFLLSSSTSSMSPRVDRPSRSSFQMTSVSSGRKKRIIPSNSSLWALIPDILSSYIFWHQETAGSLNVLTNLVVVWNTVYTQEVLKKHQAEGHVVDEKDFEHLSPARFAHINRWGRYTFQQVEQLEGNGLRPLRS